MPRRRQNYGDTKRRIQRAVEGSSFWITKGLSRTWHPPLLHDWLEAQTGAKAALLKEIQQQGNPEIWIHATCWQVHTSDHRKRYASCFINPTWWPLPLNNWKPTTLSKTGNKGRFLNLKIIGWFLNLNLLWFWINCIILWIVAKAWDGQRYPCSAQVCCAWCWGREQGSGPKGVDDLCFNTYGEFSPSGNWDFGLRAGFGPQIWD